MQPLKALGWIGTLIVTMAILGCGGGGTNSSPSANSNPSIPITPISPPVTPTQPATNYVRLQSDTGDYIGQGMTYTYTPASASIDVEGSGNLISVTIHGDKNWHGDFKVMDSMSKVEPGAYTNLQRYPFHDPTQGGLDWYGDGRGCNTLVGSFTVDKATFINSTLSSVDFHFEQHCEGATAALRGDIHWVGDPATLPIGATPPGSWQPSWGITPNAVNFVYLDSDAKDYVGAGWKYGYTQATAILSVTASGQVLSVAIDGDEKWNGSFQVMGTSGQLRTGDTGKMEGSPSNVSQWYGEGRACGTASGWFSVDKATYVNGALTEVDLRFEQLCVGSTRALHGAIHWTSADTTTPPGPVNPPPAGLWQPASGSTPATGNYAYFESEAGDFVGGGQTYLYTQANSVFSMTANAGVLWVAINGDIPWYGNVATMNALSQLQPGYYADLRRYPFHNPVKGGLSWSGNIQGCMQLYGWFVIDSVTYVNGTLTAIDLRFEQHCEGAAPALHGAIHWTSTDTTLPPGPVNPPPANLWAPPAGLIPASGNYIFLQSQLGNYVGQGQTYLYTPSTATVTQITTGNNLHLDIAGANHWTSNIRAMYFLNELAPGYYEVNDANYYNPVRGDMYWGMDSFGCGNPTGWFVVDNVAYVNGEVSSIDARFEQLCVGESAPLYGAIHWVF